jgi:hypothetical protein
MAEEILIGPYLMVNTVDLSAYVEEMTINREGALEEFTTSNVGGTAVYKRRMRGPVDFNIVVKFSDDFAAAKVHITLSTAFDLANFVVVAALHGPTPAATNEVWTDTMTFGSLPAGGAVGARLNKSITFVHASGVPVADITP